MKPLRSVLLVLPIAMGCRVYDETLLSRADAQSDLGHPTDIAADTRSDVTADRADTAVDAADAADVTDAADALDAADAADVTDATDAGDASDAADAADVTDVPADVTLSCERVLDAGTESAPCIEPVSGHLWDPNDPRLFAPAGLAVTVDHMIVGDRGSGRVISFDLGSSAAPVRIAGSGRIGIGGIGVATGVSLGSPTALAITTSGDTLIADSDAHAVYRLHGGMLDLANPFLTFPTGPFGIAYTPDTHELFVTGGNRVYSVVIPDTGASTAPPTPLVGQACGTGCSSTFNGDGMAGTSTLVGNPAGLDADTTWVYFADRQNCRVRRFRRSDPVHQIETFAGSMCNPTADPFGSTTVDTLNATLLRMGEVSDVKIGFDGTVYVADQGHCVIYAVRPAQTTTGSPQARLIAGSRFGCNQPTGRAAPPLGPIGGLATSTDRSVIYFADVASQRVGRITGTAMGGAATITFALTPGAIPSVGDALPRTRVGRMAGLAAGPDGTPLYLADNASGRVWRLDPTARSMIGDGTLPWLESMDPIAGANIPPTTIQGLSLESARLLMGLPTLGVIAQLTDANVRRVAGRLTDPSSTADAGTDAGTDAGADASVLATNRAFNAPTAPLATPNATVFADANSRVYSVSTAAAGTEGVVTQLAGAGSTGMTPDGTTGVPALSAYLGRPTAFAQDAAGRTYIADSARSLVWSIGLESPPRARIVAGVADRAASPAMAVDAEGLGTTILLSNPSALAFNGTDTLFIADRGVHRVRALNLTTGALRTIAGRGTVTASPASSGDYGPAMTAQIADPCALVYLPNTLYVGECATGRVRAIRLP